MSRERDRNRKMFHTGHFEVIAARFREQVSEYAEPEAVADITYGTDSEGIADVSSAASIRALYSLAKALAERFEFDNESFDRNIFLERCGFIQ
jgi:hypothetical protein